MRIASYNIRKAVGLDWQRNGNRIVDVLAEINADVVVLQEADKRLGRRSGVLPLERLQNELDLRLVDVAIRPDSHGWHGNSIFCRTQAGEGCKTARLDLPAFEPRGAVSVLLGGSHIEIIGVHLALAASTRNKQLSTLAKRVADADHPVLIAGDFNMWRRGADLTKIFGSDSQMIMPGNSFHAARPTAALDRFILKGSIQHVASHVHSSALAARASDHLPIVIDVSLGGMPE